MNDAKAPPIRPRVQDLGEKIGAVVLIALVVGLFLNTIFARRPLDLDAMGQVGGALVGAAFLTLLVTTLAYFVGMGLGFLIGWQRTSRHRPIRGPATIWIEAVRGTPLFVQLFLVFHLFSKYNPGGLDFSTRVFVTGLTALLLNTSAYQAEIFRAGFQSVAAGQIEAARAIGLDPRGTMRHVVFPQAIRLVVPPLVNEYVALLKASSLLAIFGVHELAYRAKTATSLGQPWLETYILVTALYLLMIVPLTKVVGLLERRFRIPGLGMQPVSARVAAAPRRAPVARAMDAYLRSVRTARLLRQPHNVLRPVPDAPSRPW